MYNSRITNPVSEKMVYDADGHQIVNLYDAAGRKYKSIVYTNLATTATPYYDIAQYSFDIDTIWYNVTEYAGNIENRYTRTDTAQRIFNTTGYYAGGVYYHYIKDHVGNINAVVNSVADTLVQSTIYYASGVPMVESKGIPYQYYNAYGVQPNQNFGRDEQPYLYNGKEFIEAHGLNEYDSQARMYFAPVMRTTTMDPLAEKYYHISPYAWCGNNPIAFVDPHGEEWADINGHLIENHKNIQAYFFYNPNDFTSQTYAMAMQYEMKHGEGTVALSSAMTEDEFAEDWKAMGGENIQQVNINHHGSNQAIHLDYQKEEYITSTGTSFTQSGISAKNVSDLSTPSGNISNAILYLNTCHSNSVGSWLGTVSMKIFNQRIPGTSAKLVGSKETLMQSFMKNFNFLSIRGTSAGVSYNQFSQPEPQFLFQSWTYIDRE